MKTETEWIELSGEPLDAPAAIAFVNRPQSGGIDIFLGMTRTHHDERLGELEALDYDAYPEMAQKQILEMVEAARQRWPMAACAVLHRTGRVAVGEASVIIAVSCPHRAEAFEACRYLIDAVKASAAIWKKDVYRTGGAWHHDPG